MRASDSTLPRILVLATVGLAAFGSVAGAAEGPCSVISRSDAVAIVICAKSADIAAWRDAGLKACAGKSLCNAWIWDDQSKAPKTAPKTDAEMSKAEASSARAIWIHDDQKLVLIRQIPK